ncbi:hypothetical protein Tco_0593442 [Tanacetum coccineum]
MSMSVQKSQVHKMAKLQDGETRLCLVDDLKVFKITISLTSQDKGTSSCLKSKDTTTYSQDKRHEVYELKTKDKAYILSCLLDATHHHPATAVDTVVVEVGTADNTGHTMVEHTQVGCRLPVVEYYKP